MTKLEAAPTGAVSFYGWGKYLPLAGRSAAEGRRVGVYVLRLDMHPTRRAMRATLPIKGRD